MHFYQPQPLKKMVLIIGVQCMKTAFRDAISCGDDTEILSKIIGPQKIAYQQTPFVKSRPVF